MTRSWVALGVLALGVMLIGVDSTVLTVAIPLVSEELGARATEVLWIGDIYSFVLAGLLVTMGSLGDRIGHRKLLLCGATAFGIGSILAAYAPSAVMLIGARALFDVAGPPWRPPPWH
jgi:DHA2 family multidrug resistance protein-like MFS transporter